MKGKKLKKIHEFNNEAQEQAFWSDNDSSDYIDWDKANITALPKLKPGLKTISIRLPEIMIAELKVLANKRDVPYQSLMKIFISERIEQELRGV